MLDAPAHPVGSAGTRARSLRARDRRGGAARGPAVRAGPRRRGQRRPGAACSATPPHVPAEVAVTSTKLVELRNPDEDGRAAPAAARLRPAGHARERRGLLWRRHLRGSAARRRLRASSPPGCSPSCPPTCGAASTEILATVDEEKWPLRDQLRARPVPADHPAQRQRPGGRRRGVLRTRPRARPRAVRPTRPCSAPAPG